MVEIYCSYDLWGIGRVEGRCENTYDKNPNTYYGVEVNRGLPTDNKYAAIGVAGVAITYGRNVTFRNIKSIVTAMASGGESKECGVAIGVFDKNGNEIARRVIEGELNRDEITIPQYYGYTLCIAPYAAAASTETDILNARARIYEVTIPISPLIIAIPVIIIAGVGTMYLLRRKSWD